MKKRTILTATLIILVLLLAACNREVPQGERPLETEAALKIVQTGTQGMEISILPNTPPPILYDENELIAIVEVNNKGNYDLQLQDCFVDVTGFDRSIIGGDFGRPVSCAAGMDILEGKNVYNTEGGSNQIELRSPYVSLPDNVYEYSPLLNFVTCYNYITKANPSVCIDPLFYQITSEQKACTPTDVITGGGQGGPVGISYVGVEMTGNRAIFEINVKNFGSGRVLSPYVDIRSCGQTAFDYVDLDRVRYSVDLPSGGPLDCKPRDGFVRLNENQGKIVCDYTTPGTSAFETILQVEMDYAYIQSLTKQIKIIATPR